MSDEELEKFEQELLEIQPLSLEGDQVDMAMLQCFSGELAALPPKSMREGLLDELELQALSAELSVSQPAPLKEDLLETLALAPMEAELRTFSPPALSDSLLDKFTSAAEAAEKEEVSEKVIPFPSETQKKKGSMKWLATAAVACMGLFLGYNAMSPAGNQTFTGQTTADHGVAHVAPLITEPIGQLLNVSNNSTVISAQDQGLVPNKTNTQYFRAMKVLAKESVTIENEDGERVVVERPVMRTVLVPAETD